MFGEEAPFALFAQPETDQDADGTDVDRPEE
jgi:hypothetical protein